MTDPAAQEGVARWLAWGHPLWMLAALALAGLALRSGLALRRARRRGDARGRRAERRRHLRLAKPALAMVFVGFAAGPLSMLWLRHREPFGTAHAWLGCAALVLFTGAGILGRRLERGGGRPPDAHALLATLAVLAAAVAALAGLVLLP